MMNVDVGGFASAVSLLIPGMLIPYFRDVAYGVRVVIAGSCIQVADLRLIAIQPAFRVLASVRGLAIPTALWLSAATLTIVRAVRFALRRVTNGSAFRTIPSLALRWTDNCTVWRRTPLMTHSIYKSRTRDFALWRCTNWSADLVASGTTLPKAFRVALLLTLIVEGRQLVDLLRVV
jgi:hypothetical protein